MGAVGLMGSSLLAQSKLGLSNVSFLMDKNCELPGLLLADLYNWHFSPGQLFFPQRAGRSKAKLRRQHLPCSHRAQPALAHWSPLLISPLRWQSVGWHSCAHPSGQSFAGEQVLNSFSPAIPLPPHKNGERVARVPSPPATLIFSICRRVGNREHTVSNLCQRLWSRLALTFSMWAYVTQLDSI